MHSPVHSSVITASCLWTLDVKELTQASIQIVDVVFYRSIPHVFVGDGAPRLDPHAAQRAAAVVSPGHHDPRQGHVRELHLGR